jgi:glucose-6-phosphate isomerase
MAVGARPVKHADIEPLTELKAWKALGAHYKKVRRSHLENFLRRTRRRGERLTAEDSFDQWGVELGKACWPSASFRN